MISLNELYVPHSYEEGVYAGLAQQLKYLYVEEGVKSLPENAFKNCPELTFCGAARKLGENRTDVFLRLSQTC